MFIDSENGRTLITTSHSYEFIIVEESGEKDNHEDPRADENNMQMFDFFCQLLALSSKYNSLQN